MKRLSKATANKNKSASAEMAELKADDSFVYIRKSPSQKQSLTPSQQLIENRLASEYSLTSIQRNLSSSPVKRLKTLGSSEPTSRERGLSNPKQPLSSSHSHPSVPKQRQSSISSPSFFKSSSLLSSPIIRTASHLSTEKMQIYTDYPPKQRGFLELYSEKAGFSEKLRRVLGINSFADTASIGLFPLELMELDLKEKIPISTTGKIRLSSAIKSVKHRELLDVLRAYDRNMSYWLSNDIAAYQHYTAYMTNFFNDNNLSTMSNLFRAIPTYQSLPIEITHAISRKKYNETYSNCIDILEQYEMVYHREHLITYLEDTISAHQMSIASFSEEAMLKEGTMESKGLDTDLNLEKSEETTEMPIQHNGFSEGVNYNAEITALEQKIEQTEINIKRENSILKQEHLSSIMGFKKSVKLNPDFFEIFSQLKMAEASEILKPIIETPKNIPLWNEGPFCEEQFYSICLCFFGTLCRQKPRFYDMAPGDGVEDIYINQIFRSRFRSIQNSEAFSSFMIKGKKAYRDGLLAIVLHKTLSYISKELAINVEDSEGIIKEAMNLAADEFPEFKNACFQDYNEPFFKFLSKKIFESISNSINLHSEPYYLDTKEGVNETESEEISPKSSSCFLCRY
jgi:hypothetical protein